MYQVLIIFCGLLFFIYGFGVSLLIQNFINNRSHLIGFGKGLFPFTGIIIYCITALLFCFVINIFFGDNYLILFISNFIFNFVLVFFLLFELFVTQKTRQLWVTAAKQARKDFPISFLCVLILYCVFVFVQAEYHQTTAGIWQINAVGSLYITSFFHIIMPEKALNHLSILSSYIYPFAIISFTFYTIKHLYLLFFNKPLNNTAPFILLLIFIACSYFIFGAFSFINMVLIICAIILLMQTRHNHLFSYRKILLSSGLLLITYLVGSVMNLYIWVIIAFVYLILQILTSAVEIIASVILFCLLGVLPFSYEIGRSLINNGGVLSTSAVILWIGVLALLVLLTYCIFSRSGTIRMINYMLNINKGFSVISVIFLTSLFAFSTSHNFAIDNTVVLWQNNITYLDHFFSSLSLPKNHGLEIFFNIMFFLSLPILTMCGWFCYWWASKRTFNWRYSAFFYLLFSCVCFNPVALTVWSVLLSNLMNSQQQSMFNLFGVIWVALITTGISIVIITSINHFMSNYKKQTVVELPYWIKVDTKKLPRRTTLKTYDNRGL